VLADRQLGKKGHAMTTLGLAQIVIDSGNAKELATFYRQLFDRPLADGANEFFALVPPDPDGGCPPLMFLAVPEPRRGKNRLHLDLVGPDRHAAVERAVAPGRPRSASWTSTGPSGRRLPIRRETCSTSAVPIRPSSRKGQFRSGKAPEATGGRP
jgi:hypothetical protein